MPGEGTSAFRVPLPAGQVRPFRPARCALAGPASGQAPQAKGFMLL
jgi:hypothetical protein